MSTSTNAATLSTAEETELNETKATGTERLYEGKGAIDFVGRSKLWYAIAIGLVVISAVAMLLRGFNLGIDFEGGTKMSMPAGELVAEQVEDAFVDATGVTPELTQIVGAGDSRTLEINSERLTQEQICLLYTSPSPRDLSTSRMPSSA